jgi:alpha-mannosidase
MKTYHLVSHTHWDREWYQPFQVFRMRLVHLMDNLFEILEKTPEYKYFMLDGQTIVMEDYLEIRPEKRSILEGYIKSGRILCGPWYVLPDEFLVSPEAIIRNLILGGKIARQFGRRMDIGYIPDPFGHIGQMPQILNGFHIQDAVFRRGLSDEPIELWWDAPDGSSVLTSYLRDGYGNATFLLNLEPEYYPIEVQREVDIVLPFVQTDQVLLMQGTDHTEPNGNTPEGIQLVNSKISPDRLIHSTLPEYIRAVRNDLEKNQTKLPHVYNDLRSSKSHDLLPAVLSARVWVKQRNHVCETDLERWAEPFSTWSSLAIGKTTFEKAALVENAWKLLLSCHPHDSICGCSIDQVHEEMKPRFDQVDQVTAMIKAQSLAEICAVIDTKSSNTDAKFALTVFNATPFTQAGNVEGEISITKDLEGFSLVDDAANEMIYDLIEPTYPPLILTNVKFDRETLRSSLGVIQQGKFEGFSISTVNIEKSGDQTISIDLSVTDRLPVDDKIVQDGIRNVSAWLENDEIANYDLTVKMAPTKKIVFYAKDIPSYGYRTFWILKDGRQKTENSPLSVGDHSIENSRIKVYVDKETGQISVFDKTSGQVYQGIGRIEDGGDIGDEYNYCPPSKDKIFTAKINDWSTRSGKAEASLVVNLSLDIPVSLQQDRKSRTEELTSCPIQITYTLGANDAYIKISGKLINNSQDHRLRIHFPFNTAANEYLVDSHFWVQKRQIEEVQFIPGWCEQPRPEYPQRLFSGFENGQTGVLVANKGLYEMQALKNSAGNSEIAVTLLRCVGWLSRDDIPLRPHHAGPGFPTPGAQEIGEHTFEMAFIPFNDGWESGIRSAYLLDTPYDLEMLPLHAGLLPKSSSIVKLEKGSFIISAIKTSNDGSGWIIRGYNPTSENQEVSLQIGTPFSSIQSISIDETDIIEKLDCKENRFTFIAAGYKICTFKVNR